MNRLAISFLVLCGFTCFSFLTVFAQNDYSDLEACLPGKYSGESFMDSWEITVLKEDSEICYLNYDSINSAFIMKYHCSIPVEELTINPSSSNPIGESRPYCEHYATVDPFIQFFQILTIVLVSLVAIGVTGFLLAKKIKKRKSQK